MSNARGSSEPKLNQTSLELDDVKVEDEPEVVSVVLMRHKIATVIGKITGRAYFFAGAGSIVDDVDIRDAEIMITTGKSKSCCGSISTPQFQIIGR